MCILALVTAMLSSNNPIATVPFDWIKPGIPLVSFEATINGQPARLTLDSGNTEKLALSEAFARKLQLKLHDPESKAGSSGVGQQLQIKMWDAKVDKLSIGELKVSNQDVHVSNYVDYLSKALGVSLDGNLGYGFMKDFAITVDYPAKTLTFVNSPNKAPGAISFRLGKKPVILVKVKINGKGPFTFALDTGASGTVISNEVASRASIALEGEIDVQGASGVVKGHKAPSVLIALGDREKRLGVTVADFFSDLSLAAGENIEGIVGYTFFNDCALTIDYPNSQILFR